MPPRGAEIAVVGARLVEVSAHGMLIESLVPMEEGLSLRLRVVIAGHKSDIEARVANCRLSASGRRRLYGVGLEFTSIPEAAQERLREILAGASAVSS
jgi:hypothetical protein